MSKENMSKKNILDYDEEKTIRPQNFTLTAMKEFYDTIESDQFQGASEDTIYKYLTNIMEIVSFKDFLRRYIYEYAGIKENFNQVTNYLELLLEIFARNDCYDPNDVEEKKKLKKKANRWLTSESVKRENMFYIGFGLDMNDKQISEFLTLVLKEPDLILRVLRKRFTGTADIMESLGWRRRSFLKLMRIRQKIRPFGRIICGRQCRMTRKCM